MMIFTANGKKLLDAVIPEPARGAWVADIEVDSTEDLGTGITLELGTDKTRATFVATKVRGEVYAGRWVGRIVGGRGKLSRDIDSRYYDSVPVRTVLNGLMADSGEELDPLIAGGILARALARWERPFGPPKLALEDIANELGVTWRVTRAGKVWLGSESWAPVPIQTSEMSRGPTVGSVVLAPVEAPLVRPGTTFNGKRVSYVVTTLHGQKLRQEVWFDEGGGDRVFAAFKDAINRLLGRRLLFLGQYPATVVAQSADGATLEVLPDDPEVRGQGLRRVPIRHGLPGCAVRVPRGTRLELAFDGGDPSRPRVANWEPGGLTLVTIGSADLAKFVALAPRVLEELQASKQSFDTHTHPSGMGPTGVPTVPMTTPSSVAAAKLKAE